MVKINEKQQGITYISARVHQMQIVTCSLGISDEHLCADYMYYRYFNS